MVIAQDIISPGTVVLKARDSLEDALKLFGQRDLKMIPVVTSEEPKKVVGVVRKDELTDYYNMRLLETLRQ